MSLFYAYLSYLCEWPVNPFIKITSLMARKHTDIRNTVAEAAGLHLLRHLAAMYYVIPAKAGILTKGSHKASTHAFQTKRQYLGLLA